MNDLAFRGVKFHVPVMTPAFKVVKIFDRLVAVIKKPFDPFKSRTS